MKQSLVFTDLVRHELGGFLNTAAGFLLRLGLTPNMVTFGGVIGHLAAAVLIANGSMTLAGFVVLLFAPLDALDGAMARKQGQPSRFGAFIDSVTDRYSEFILWGGLLVFCLQVQNWSGCLAVYLAAAGSTLVPYIRSRAESLGFTAKIGLLSRLERYLILVPAMIFNQPLWAIWIIAVLANITAFQRIFYVRKEADSKLP
jgi:CDP-diacylglycerol---glycerol-3-phosphate 3-phosphatidyltransferase